MVYKMAVCWELWRVAPKELQMVDSTAVLTDDCSAVSLEHSGVGRSAVHSVDVMVESLVGMWENRLAELSGY